MKDNKKQGKDTDTQARSGNDKLSLTVKEMSSDDQPREKLMHMGKKALTDAELLAILLRTGTAGQNVLMLAQQMLRNNDNDIYKLSKKSVSEIMSEYKGVGEAKAVTVIAALELGIRMLNGQRNKKEHFGHNSTDLFEYICGSIIDLHNEEFWAMYMDSSRKLLGKTRISAGGISFTAVDVRTLYKTALEYNAVAIAVAHNHPSGNLTPSKEDRELTRKIQAAGNILNIKLIDHLIVGIGNKINKADYYSFYDDGQL